MADAIAWTDFVMSSQADVDCCEESGGWRDGHEVRDGGMRRGSFRTLGTETYFPS